MQDLIKAIESSKTMTEAAKKLGISKQALHMKLKSKKFTDKYEITKEFKVRKI